MVWAELAFHLFTLQTKTCFGVQSSSSLCLEHFRSHCVTEPEALPVVFPKQCYFHVRVQRRECVNSSACWPCRHGEHCWTVKSWVWFRLRSGLIFVSGRRDQQKDSLRVQLCHNSSDSRSLAYSSALLQAQLDLQPCFLPITTHFHFHSSGLVSVWKDEPMWKKKIRNPYSISSCCTTERDQCNKSTDFDCLLSRSEPQPLF